MTNTNSTTYLFVIRPVDYSAAERALKEADCWLEGPRDRAVVACSGQHAHKAREMQRAAEDALEAHRVMVYPG